MDWDLFPRAPWLTAATEHLRQWILVDCLGGWVGSLPVIQLHPGGWLHCLWSHPWRCWLHTQPVVQAGRGWVAGRPHYSTPSHPLEIGLYSTGVLYHSTCRSIGLSTNASLFVSEIPKKCILRSHHDTLLVSKPFLIETCKMKG